MTDEVFSEKWLMRCLPHVRAAPRDFAIEFDTEQGRLAPDRREFDVRVAFIGRSEGTRQCETLREKARYRSRWTTTRRRLQAGVFR